MRDDIVINWLADKGFSLSDSQIAQMARFEDLVLNAPMNLTAIKDSTDFAIKHFIDSLTLLPWVDKLNSNASCIDIGTGAGFPGVPLKIARPGLNITLLDSLLKRILFLRSAALEIGLGDVECVHARVEDYAKENDRVYDMAVARAVAKLGKLVEYALPLVRPGGVFFAMKGPDVFGEIKEAEGVLEKYGAVVEGVEYVEIAPGMGRCVVVVRKR